MSGICDSPGKRAYATQREAIRAALGASRTYGKGLRVYRCPAAHWHTTSRIGRRRPA